MVNFGENVYLWRIFRGLTQGELAKKSGIPRPNLSAIESGKREVSLTTLRALADALGIGPGILVSGDVPVHFKNVDFSRESLEGIVKISLGEPVEYLPSSQKVISAMLSKIIRNRVNAKKGIYKNVLKGRQTYVINWLMLKSAVKMEILNNLLTRLDKHIGLLG